MLLSVFHRCDTIKLVLTFLAGGEGREGVQWCSGVVVRLLDFSSDLMVGGFEALSLALYVFSLGKKLNFVVSGV